MTEPSRTPKLSQSRFGFNRFTERLNSRVAMMAFVGAIVLEVVTGQGVLTWLGLR
ncbi:MAG: chlorophyll a/b-binding protein [Thermosynechococcaceae cyanobacterium]